MSQEQPQRPQAEQFSEQEPIKYGDVFNVSGELASQPIKPRDAALMQATENQALGQTQKGSPASVMQSAAAVNTAAGLVSHGDISDIAKNQGMSVSKTKVGANRVITESVGSQVVGQFVEPDVPMNDPGLVLDKNAITIGEALEASALSQAGDKPLDQSDAAAIQAAEMRATGKNHTEPGGLGAIAQSAATRNTRTMPDLQKTTLGDVVSGAREKLGSDKAVTREDAEGVIGAELRNKADMRTKPGGVAASMAAAATLNQNTKSG
ncbi:putative Seed maturation protein [Medicago truncatula]|uniref:Late embryogenesis abundant D-like protein n=1 Tax=Medicago truncatula TaxID=3880 RepID=G7IDP3_MEDTR|nr:late embryogenesis abundant protein D-34 [Medicago truncatula]AES60879.1 late embryogenesis abundant D-like protein [Medicago truncatula]RHN80177.1 putative Seed maturation protein [Medicago truncatula]